MLYHKVKACSLDIALIAGLCLFHFINLNADPPGVIAGDYTSGFREYGYFHSARNAVLFGGWFLDDWSFAYVAPLYNAFIFLAFKLFGTGFFSERLFVALCASLNTILFYVICKNTFNLFFARIATILFGFAWINWGYSRIATLDITVVTAVFLGVICFLSYMKNRKKVFLVLCGATFIVAFLLRVQSGYFAPLYFFFAFPLTTSWNERFQRMFLMLFGALLLLVPSFLFFFIPYWDAFYENVTLSAHGTLYSSSLYDCVAIPVSFVMTNFLFSNHSSIGTCFFAFSAWYLVNSRRLNFGESAKLILQVMVVWLCVALFLYGFINSEQWRVRAINYLPPFIFLIALFLSQVNFQDIERIRIKLFDLQEPLYKRYLLWLLPLLALKDPLFIVCQKIVGQTFLHELAVPHLFIKNSLGFENFLAFFLILITPCILLALTSVVKSDALKKVLFCFFLFCFLFGFTVPLIVAAQGYLPLDAIPLGETPGVDYYGLVALYALFLFVLFMPLGFFMRVHEVSFRKYIFLLILLPFLLTNVTYAMDVLSPSRYLYETSREVCKEIKKEHVIVMGNAAGTVVTECPRAQNLSSQALTAADFANGKPVGILEGADKINNKPFERFHPEYLVTYGLQSMSPPGPDAELRFYVKEMEKSKVYLEKINRYSLPLKGWSEPFVFDFYRVKYSPS